MTKKSPGRTLTQADADFLQRQFSKVFATKEDIKQFATKEDIKQFATKDDIKQFATKEDIGQFATKEDIKALPTKKDVENIVIDVINKVVIPGMDSMADGIKRDLGMKIDALDRKFESQQARLDRQNARIENLEKIHPRGRHAATI